MNENDILLKVFRMVQNWSERVNIGPRTNQTKFGNHCMSRTCVSRFLEHGDIEVLAVFERWEASIRFLKMDIVIW